MSYRRACALLLWVPAGLLAPAAAHGQFQLFPDAPAPQRARGLAGLLEQLGEQFTDLSRYVEVVLVLLLAMLLSAVIAYHPLTRGKASTITEIEQPKTFIMYALAGALAGYIALISPAIGFIIFGIGGLMRFRTEVGEAKDTGRVILVTIVGICCGVQAFLIAIFATLFGWLLVWHLERQNAGRMQVKGLEREKIQPVAEAYRGVLTEAGCTILGEKKNFLKGQVTFVFKAPRELDREEVEGRIAEQLPKEIRGAVDWEIS
jgi:uncharacterized membrane protein YhiD involved in acid resistance